MNNLAGLYRRIYSISNISDLVSQWRSKSEKIVFTNGCFDIIHRGHVEYLHQAADWGTKLIIGLNSDSSVKRLKGDSRPLQDQLSRALVLASLRVVDSVCIFEEDTPLELIKVVSPDFLIKGGDYIPEQIVGYNWVYSYGGKILTIPLVDGYSTTGIIQKF